MSVGLDPVILGGQWGYARRPESDSVLGDIWLEPLDLHSAIQCWYDLSIAHEEFEHVEEAVGALADPVRCPSIVSVDSYHLPFSSTYRREHFPHALYVVGVTATSAQVVDGYRGYRFEGELDLDILREAMASPAARGRGAMSLMRCQHDPEHSGGVTTVRLCDVPPGQVPSGSLVVPQLERNLRMIDSPGAGESVGGAAVIATAKGIHESVGAGLDASVMAELLSLLGSVSSQRALNADFLSWAAVAADLPVLADGAEVAGLAARRWLMLRNLVYLRASGSSPDQVAAIHRAADQMIQLADLESELYSVIRSVV